MIEVLTKNEKIKDSEMLERWQQQSSYWNGFYLIGTEKNANQQRSKQVILRSNILDGGYRSVSWPLPIDQPTKSPRGERWGRSWRKEESMVAYWRWQYCNNSSKKRSWRRSNAPERVSLFVWRPCNRRGALNMRVVHFRYFMLLLNCRFLGFVFLPLWRILLYVW